MTQDLSTVTIRQAEPGDLKAVIELCARTSRPAWNLAGILGNPRRLVLVALEGDRVVGIAKTHWHPTADGPAPAGHYLGGILVDPAARRRGIGTTLTARRLEWIWQRAAAAYYFTNESNTASIALHRRHGFTCLGRFGCIRSVTADDGGARLLLFRADKPGSSPCPRHPA